MTVPKAFFEACQPGGNLFGLVVPVTNDILLAKSAFPRLSTQYWNFVEQIGIGEADNSGLAICLPCDLKEESNNPGLHLFRGAAYQNLRQAFGGKNEGLQPLPSEISVISRPGASWFYCLRNNGEQMCYTYDFGTQELEPSYIDFNAFVQEHLNHHLEDDLI